MKPDYRTRLNKILERYKASHEEFTPREIGYQLGVSSRSITHYLKELQGFRRVKMARSYNSNSTGAPCNSVWKYDPEPEV